MGYISKKYDIDPGTVVEMVRDGVVDWRIEGLYDFWIFYQELIKTRQSKRDVREELMLHYNINARSTYYYWINKATEVFS